MINRSEGDENLLSLKGIIHDYSTELSQVQGYLSLSHLGRGPGTDMLIRRIIEKEKVRTLINAAPS